MSKLLDQCRKPTGWLGRLFLWIMSRGHSKLTEWGLQDEFHQYYTRIPGAK
jgi:hypothetical protein